MMLRFTTNNTINTYCLLLTSFVSFVVLNYLIFLGLDQAFAKKYYQIGVQHSCANRPVIPEI